MKYLLIATLAFSISAFATLTDRVTAGNQMTAFEFGELLHQTKVAGFQDLLEQAKKKLGASTIEGIQEIVRMCPVFSSESTRGHFVPVSSVMLSQRNGPVQWETVIKNRTVTTFLSQPNLGTKVTPHPGYFSIELEKKPTICLKSNLNLGQATIVFVHELTHWVGYQLLEDLHVETFPTHKEFVAHMLNRKGGEVEATRNEMIASKNLQFPIATLPSVDPSATREIAKAIYSTYEQFYQNEFGHLVVGKINRITDETNFAITVLGNLEPHEGRLVQKDYLDSIAAHQANMREQSDKLTREYSGYIAR